MTYLNITSNQYNGTRRLYDTHRFFTFYIVSASGTSLSLTLSLSEKTPGVIQCNKLIWRPLWEVDWTLTRRIPPFETLLPLVRFLFLPFFLWQDDFIILEARSINLLPYAHPWSYSSSLVFLPLCLFISVTCCFVHNHSSFAGHCTSIFSQVSHPISTNCKKLRDSSILRLEQ